MSDESLTPESYSFSTQHDETDSFHSEGRISYDDQYVKLKTELKSEKRKWNVFEETGTGDKSVSERRYDKSLQKKYKYLKVQFDSIFFQIIHSFCQGFHHGFCLHCNPWIWDSEQRGHNIYGQPNQIQCNSNSLSRRIHLL